MRPLALQLENFASFRTRQVLDFSGCDLFAIAGPTGSGKSSLLDALVFALYGRVPRMGKSCSEMISLGRDRMSVVLDFRCGDAVYRVSRILRRSGRGSEAQIERLSKDGEGEPLADGVRKVDEEIVRLVGLGYEAFTQAVILPQGEFARFLKSNPKDRQEILRDILRLQVYEKMRLCASKQAATLEQEVRSWEAVLESEYAEASPAAIEALESERQVLGAANAALAVELARAESDLLDLRRRHGLTEELLETQRRLEMLKARATAVGLLEQQIEAARRATFVVPLLDRSDQAAAAHDDDAARVSSTAQALEEARAAHARGAQALEDALAAARELPELESRIEALAEAVTLAGLLREGRQRARQATEARVRLARDTEKARAAEAGARREAAQLLDRAVSAEARVATLAYDAPGHQHLDGLRDRAGTLASLREAARRAGASRLNAAAEHDRAREVASRAERERHETAERRAEAEARRLSADQALRHAEQSHAVARLRHELQPGDACPVCEQAVGVVPSHDEAVDLHELEAACRGAVANERAAREAEADARARSRAASEALERTEAAFAQARDEEVEATAVLEDAVQALWRDGGEHLAAHARHLQPEAEAILTLTQEPVEVGAGSGSGRARRGKPGRRAAAELPLFAAFTTPARATVAGRGGSPETVLLDALARLQALRLQHDDATAGCRVAQSALEKGQALCQSLTAQVDLLEQSLEDATRAEAEATAGLEALQARIAALSGTDGDPAALRESLVQRRTSLGQRLDAAREAERAAATSLATAAAQAAEATRRAEESRALAASARASAEEAAREAGFTDAAATRTAFCPLAEQERLSREVQNHHRELAASQSRLAELGAALGEARVDARTLAAAESATRQKRALHHDAVRREATLDQKLHELRRRAELALARQRELLATREQLAVQKQLATDLRSDAFQAYLLEEAFRELVAGASHRLQELSNRYTLEFHGDAFHVLDHDNARERRSAETLSGGETFLASLALALELSQQVQRAAGAVPLDSLFIDEGFGTLDPETLDTIADAILALPQAGRMVGIITHIAELTERLPVCLRVDKRPEGSTVSLRRG